MPASVLAQPHVPLALSQSPSSKQQCLWLSHNPFLLELPDGRVMSYPFSTSCTATPDEFAVSCSIYKCSWALLPGDARAGEDAREHVRFLSRVCPGLPRRWVDRVFADLSNLIPSRLIFAFLVLI